MEAKIKRLPDAELEVMLIAWELEPPATASDILQRLRASRKWSLQTLLTVLSRLADKGFLSCEKVGRSNLYRPLIANLFDAKAIDAKDLAKLRSYLDELEEKS